MDSSSLAIGFRTGDSMYRFDADTGMSKRLKLSGGPGQGQWHAAMMCLFVPSNPFDDLRIKYRDQTVHFRLGYLSADGRNGHSFHKNVEIPEGCQPVVLSVEKSSRTVLGWIAAERMPGPTLTPVEKLYHPDGTSTTHIGHAIDRIYTSTTVFNLDAQAALERFLREQGSARTPPPVSGMKPSP